MSQGRRRPRVLLADDDASIGRAVSRLLAESCELVGCVGDTVALFDAVARLRPDVVLLDLSLPGGTSWRATARSIAATTPDVKVVVFTGHDDEDLKALAGGSVAAAVVCKLRASEELLPTIYAVVDGASGAAG